MKDRHGTHHTLDTTVQVPAIAVYDARETRRITGVVRFDDDDSPIRGANVEVTVQQGAEQVVVARADTDAEGRFHMRLAAGTRCEFPVVTIRDSKKRILHTTDPLELRRGEEWTLAIGVPATARVLVDQSSRKLKPQVRVGSLLLAADAVERASGDVVLDIAHALVEREPNKALVARVRKLSPDLLPTGLPARTLCGTQVLETIEALIRIRGLGREVQLELDRILRLRHMGFAEATYDCPNFSVTYQTTGPAAVDPSTAAEDVFDPGTATVIGSLAAGGPPTYIKRICFWLERALAAYTGPEFGLLNPAAGGKIPVVVNSSPYGSASSFNGTIYLNNALGPDLLCAVAVHELFHIVQFEYGGSGTWQSSVFEGGAVFAEDTAADQMNRYLDEAGNNFNGSGVLAATNQSISTNSYKCSLFWRYVSEQQSPDIHEPFVGVETYRKVIEKCSAGSYSTADVKAAIRELPYFHDFYEFHYLDPMRRDRTNSETMFGNYALACYLKDLGVNVPDRRFEFIEDEENIHIDSVVPGAPSATTLASVALAGSGTLTPGGPLAFSSSVVSFGHRFYEVTVDAAVDNIAVNFAAGGTLTSGIFQIVLIDEDGQVRDIHRTDATSYSKRLTSLRDGKRIAKLGIVVSGAATAGSFNITVQSAAPACDVMVTRWHSVSKREYEIDSRGWTWTWVSPDIWVDNDADGVADGTVYFDYNNKLHVRLHNKGNLAASGIQVEFWYQNAAGGLSDAAWLPVQNEAGIIQTLTGLGLAAGATNDWSVDWSPAAAGAGSHYCVRAVVTVPGDPNTDNKRVLSNFTNVVVHPGMWIDLELIRRNIELIPRQLTLSVVPRLTPELEISLRDVRDAPNPVLGPGEAILDQVRLTHRKLRAVHEHQHDAVVDKQHDSRYARQAIRHPNPLLRAADPGGYYPTDPRALPPGVAGKPMVTLVHSIDGVAVGGATFMITVEEPSKADGNGRGKSASRSRAKGAGA